MRESLQNNLTKHYTITPNAVATDTRLSLGARVLYMYLAGQDDSFIFWNKVMMKELGIKKPHTMAKYFKELLETNWISRNKNKFGGFDYTLHPTSRKEDKYELLRADINNPLELQKLTEVRADNFMFSVHIGTKSEYLNIQLTNKNFHSFECGTRINKQQQKEIWNYLFEHRLNDVIQFIKIKER